MIRNAESSVACPEILSAMSLLPRTRMQKTLGTEDNGQISLPPFTRLNKYCLYDLLNTVMENVQRGVRTILGDVDA